MKNTRETNRLIFLEERIKEVSNVNLWLSIISIVQWSLIVYLIYKISIS